MSAPVHFYLTFNPYLNAYPSGQTQAHEFYDLLVDEIKKNPNATLAWGKMIGADREHNPPMDIVEKILELNKSLGLATHLYISDFQNLWVGKVKAVTKDKTKALKTLSFYEGKKVELWFELSDFTLLTYTPEETANRLSELYIENDFHELQIDGLSPFTTGVRLPAFIQDLRGEQFFDELEEGEKLCLRANSGLNAESSRRVLESIQHYVFPEAMYKKIPHAAKTEIESAELDIIEHRYHNMKKNAMTYIKALEIVINDLTIGHLKRSGFGNEFFVKPDSMPPKLYMEAGAGLAPINKWHKNYSITQLIYLVERCIEQNNFCFKRAFAEHKPFIQWMTKDLVPVLKNNYLLEIRGTLAHNDSNAIEEKDAIVVRNLILGIGCQGLIYQALQSFYHKQFNWMNKTSGDYSKVDFKKLLAS